MHGAPEGLQDGQHTEDLSRGTCTQLVVFSPTSPHDCQKKWPLCARFLHVIRCRWRPAREIAKTLDVMKLLLFRHAETAWTITGQHTGRTDLELTPAGEAQARATGALVARVLGAEQLSALYSSPRRRALHTAELALGTARAPSITPLLAEVDYGEYEGLTPAEIRSRSPGWNLWDKGCPGGETVEQAGARADQFVATLSSLAEGQVVCAVSHGHMIRVLTARLLGLPAREGRLFTIATASIAELVRVEGRFALSRWNLTL
jgi:broad specificity phosphatase PhoE